MRTKNGDKYIDGIVKARVLGPRASHRSMHCGKVLNISAKLYPRIGGDAGSINLVCKL